MEYYSHAFFNIYYSQRSDIIDQLLRKIYDLLWMADESCLMNVP